MPNPTDDNLLLADILICLYLEHIASAADLAGEHGLLHKQYPGLTARKVRPSPRALRDQELVKHEHHGQEQWWELTKLGNHLVEEHLAVAAAEQRRSPHLRERRLIQSAVCL